MAFGYCLMHPQVSVIIIGPIYAYHAAIRQHRHNFSLKGTLEFRQSTYNYLNLQMRKQSPLRLKWLIQGYRGLTSWWGYHRHVLMSLGSLPTLPSSDLDDLTVIGGTLGKKWTKELQCFHYVLLLLGFNMFCSIKHFYHFIIHKGCFFGIDMHESEILSFLFTSQCNSCMVLALWFLVHRAQTGFFKSYKATFKCSYNNYFIIKSKQE